MKKWNKKNVLWMVLYAVLYAVGTAIVCVTGAIHPILFVCYQITAGLLLSGIIIYVLPWVRNDPFTSDHSGCCSMARDPCHRDRSTCRNSTLCNEI